MDAGITPHAPYFPPRPSLDPRMLYTRVIRLVRLLGNLPMGAEANLIFCVVSSMSVCRYLDFRECLAEVLTWLLGGSASHRKKLEGISFWIHF